MTLMAIAGGGIGAFAARGTGYGGKAPAQPSHPARDCHIQSLLTHGGCAISGSYCRVWQSSCALVVLQISRGVAVLGYMAVGNRGLVLLATRTKTVVTLPGNHSVKLVTGSKWVDLLLEVTAPAECNGAIQPLMPVMLNFWLFQALDLA